ncbi:GTP-Rho binding exocyst subunit [Neurospora sp. IMI 360204]|nr:GTP-Rho binding exocyst subunit [Neurospora sp. IMI 360204]
MSRAERFEDEKRRIIESCFNKKDDDGSTIETYITHIRITEFSTHPTSPPPPQARTPNTEKPRIIIVAVRKSGRVRLHKSKENPNGTFSIGKTWFLDDLSDIESFTSPTASPNFREWAGDVGFIVTLGKPYYWQAQTDKEKKFFIASLIKIYGKYTGGRVPRLIGFDQRELDQVLGGAQAPRRPADRGPPSRSGTQIDQQGAIPSPSRSATFDNPPSRSGPLDHPPSRSATLDTAPSSGNVSMTSGYGSFPAQPPPPAGPPPSAPPPGPPPSRPVLDRMPSRTNLVPNSRERGPSPSRSMQSSNVRSQEDLPLRRMNSNQSQDSRAPSLAARTEDSSSLRPGSRAGTNGDSKFTTPEPARAPTPSAPAEAPERKRPPMDPLRPLQPDNGLVPAPLLSPGLRGGRGDVPAPLMSPGLRGRGDPVLPPPRSPGLPPPRSVDRMIPRKNSVLTQNEPQRAPSPAPPMADQVVTPIEPRKIELPVSVAPSPTASTPASIKSPVSEGAADSPEQSRPGLGPMIKSKKSKVQIAGAIWKAATAASAFKPRPGGAADRLRNLTKNPEGPDGITSVVPAPPRPTSSQKQDHPAPDGQAKPADGKAGVPGVKVTDPKGKAEDAPKDKKKDEPLEPEEPQRAVVAGNDIKYLTTLGIDPSILDTKTTEFAKWLDYFGWVPGKQMRSRNFDEMRIDVDRELSKAQAGGWLARFQEEDERVDAIKNGIDVAIAECDELDNLLTLYSVELSTLSDDIAYIEAQGQGLQVQAANQKLLKKELESLLATCAISESDLAALKVAPLETATGVEDIESALVTLFKAMVKIDPAMGAIEGRRSEDGSGGQAIGLNSDYGNMRIVQEKREMYMAESTIFMRRLMEFMARRFEDAFRATKMALDNALSKKVDPRNHEAGRDILWMYSPLILYAKEVDVANWDRIMQIYQDISHPIYKAEFREAMESWKKNARKMTGEETAELLFTSGQEKKEEGIALAARKLTVKRSQTLARTLRSQVGEGKAAAAAEKTPDSRALPYEVFAGVLDDLLPLVEMEQNFVVDFFHASTLEQVDFPDLVVASRPQDRRGNDLKRHRMMEPDRDLARRITRAMEVIFMFFDKNLQNLMDWVLMMDPLQGVGVLATLERKMADISQSNQDYLNTVLQKLHGNLETKFKKFVDEQVRAIEETKVKIKKRKGVIHFMRIFPQFSSAVENMLSSNAAAGGNTMESPVSASNLTVRRMIDREYDRIIKTMFDSLKVIARENPAVSTLPATGGGGSSSFPSFPGSSGAASMISSVNINLGSSLRGSSGADTEEDKEALNFHILLIENMNHFIEEVENPKGLEVLDDWREAAQQELAEHLNLYLNAVMRRPLGKLLEYLENVEAQLAAGKNPGAVAAQASNAKSTFNKLLSGYDGKEVRKGIETLRKRVEKHFGGDDDAPGGDGASAITTGSSGSRVVGGGNRSLVMRVLKECERFYGEVEMRVGKITTEVYGGEVLWEWPRAEVKSAFSHVGR